MIQNTDEHEHEHSFSYSHSIGVHDVGGTNKRIEHIVICENCGDMRKVGMSTLIDGIPYEKHREKMEKIIQENELLRLKITQLENHVQDLVEEKRAASIICNGGIWAASTSCNCGTSAAPCPYHPVAKNTGPEC